MTGANIIGSWLEKILCCICLAFTFWFITAFIYVALNTLHYPFHLEWMEGQFVDVVARVRAGLPIYTAPSINYVPFIYTPFYYYTVAFVSLFTGVDFFAARLVSFLSTLGTAAILFAWIRREGGSWFIGLITAGLFFATYRLSGRWFDNSRVDSLSLFFAMSGAYVCFHTRGTRNIILAALLFTVAFFTKQTTLFIMLAVGASVALIDFKHAVRIGLTTALLIALGILFAHFITDGWFEFYVFTVPKGHALDIERYGPHFIKGELIRQLTAFLCLSFAAIACLFYENKRKAYAYGALLAGVVLGSYVMRIHSYSFVNVLMPMHAVVALAAGLGLLALMRLGDWRILCLSLGLLIIQQHALLYEPKKLIPTQQEIETGNMFLSRLSLIDGDIFMPDLQFVQSRIGKKSYDLGMAAFDLFRSDLGPKNDIKEGLRRDIAKAIDEQRFAALSPGIFFPLAEKRGLYQFAYHLPYPGEFVTGAVNLVQPDIYLRNVK